MDALSLEIEDTLSLPILLAWFRANCIKIFLGGVVFGLVSIPLTLIKKETYESAATLLVAPPMFKDRDETTISRNTAGQHNRSIAELMPRTLPVEAYKAIALSGPILAQVINEVPLDIGIAVLQERLDVELIKMDGVLATTGMVYTQALMFRAKAHTPELAAKTAQTWAEIFKVQVDEVAAKGIKDTFALLETLHGHSKKELELSDVALAEHKKAWNLGLIQAQLATKQTQYTEFERSLNEIELSLAAQEMKLKVLDKEIEREPQKIVYFRAPSDDAYWIAGLHQEDSSTIEPERGMRTEVSNPIYLQIRTSVVTTREAIGGLRVTKDTTVAKLVELETEMTALMEKLYDKTVERSKFTRESDSLKSSYSVVRSEYERGRMAHQTQSSDIVIAGAAVPVYQPISWGPAKLIVVAAFLGMLLTAGFLMLKKLSDMALILGPAAGKLGAFMVGNSSESSVKSVSTAGDDGDSEKPS